MLPLAGQVLKKPAQTVTPATHAACLLSAAARHPFFQRLSHSSISPKLAQQKKRPLLEPLFSWLVLFTEIVLYQLHQGSHSFFLVRAIRNQGDGGAFHNAQ